MPPRSPPQCRLWMLAATLLAAPLAGCALNGLPRIDPSGEQILIFPGETPPVAPGQPVVAAPQPVDPFTGLPAITPPAGNLPAPPVYTGSGPSVCPLCDWLQGPKVIGPPVAGVPQDRVTITPERVLAPVGSEVVLRAGVCAAEGYLLTNQRIEWMLGRQGVGQFVTVGDRGDADFMRLPWQRPSKIDNLYAIGYTAPVSACLRRNTADPADDVEVRAGDAWISVSSAAEGTSYVTAFAPGVDDWSARKASAVIYWVDAQWALPPSATVEAGRPHVLTTTVTRQSDGAPVAGWLVRYEVANGAGARLGYEAGQAAEATTDARGQASVEISPTDSNPGSTAVRVTIVRPAQAGATASPRLDVGSGQTTINWVSGLPATGLPPIEPAPAPVDGGPPFTTPPPIDAGPIDSAPVSPAPSGRPQLTVQMRRDTPDPIRVGDTVAYSVIVRNVGTAPARNILIADEFDRGLSNQYDTTGTNRVEYTGVLDLGPGESDIARLEFQVIEPGQRRHEVIVSADGAQDAFERDSFEAQPLRPVMPSLRAEMVGPRRVAVGYVTKDREIRGVVENTGATVATNVVVRLRYPVELSPTAHEPQQQGEGFREFPSGYEWTLPRLAPGQRREFRLNVECRQATRPDAPARVVMDVTADGGAVHASEADIEIAPRIGESPADGTGGPGPGGASNLRLSLSSSANPARQNSRAVLTVFISNPGTTPQKNVIVDVRLPPQIRRDASAIQRPFQELANGDLRFAAIPEIPPGGQEAILIPIDHLNQGRVLVQARAFSDQVPEASGVTADTTIDINPR